LIRIILYYKHIFTLHRTTLQVNAYFAS